MKSEYVRFRKSVGMSAFLEKSYKNTRTQKSECPYGHSDFLMLEMGLERPLRKHAGGMFLGRGRVPQISDASRRDVDEI